jgi:pantoate--beta-alanine ligase
LAGVGGLDRFLGMEVIRSAGVIRRRTEAWRREGRRVVLVPTMGALHEGHLSLVRRARKLAGRGGVVVMSIYVNPSQFGPKEDFGRYPRPFREDCRLAAAVGVDAVFAPRTLYAADESTRVVESACSSGRCGPSRPGHFDGVCTVVAKLFLIVQPHAAVFGEKDAQQCDVIARMVRDLCIPVRVVRAPTVRDGRGVAMSSRNRYLSPEEYATAAEFAAARGRRRGGCGGVWGGCGVCGWITWRRRGCVCVRRCEWGGRG